MATSTLGERGSLQAPRTRWPRKRLAPVLLLAAVTALSAALSACGGNDRSESSAGDQSANSAALVGEFRGLAVDPAAGGMLEVTSAGLFRSADAGETWEPVNTSDTVRWLAIEGLISNPDEPSILYGWGNGIGVIRSDDGGENWRAITSNLPSDEVGALALHSNLRDTLYAWVKGQGVFRTKDGGGSWELMDGGPQVEPVAVLAHTPLEGSMNTGWLYAGTPDGVYLSMDCF